MELTVLIPVYNTKPAALLEALFSIINQTYKEPFKIIIINDASTDKGTLHTLRKIQMYRTETRDIEVINMPKNGGTSAALNTGHHAVDTEYVAIMGSDDICDSHRFAAQMAVLKADKSIDVCGTDLFSFYDHDIYRSRLFTSDHPKEPTLKNTKNGWLVNHGTVIYRQNSVMDCGAYNVNIKRGQDVDLWKRMAEAGKKFFNIKMVYYAWRRYKN